MRIRIMLLMIIAAGALTIGAWGDTLKIAVLNDLHVSPGNDNSRALQKTIDEINATSFDCVIINGDLTNEGADHELNYIHNLLGGIKHKQLVVPGNHENNWSQSATKTFVDLWGNDRFAYKVGNKVLIGMNCGPYMKMGDGHIKQEDLHWMKATLDGLVQPGDVVVSFNHYPIRNDDIDNYIDYSTLLAQYPVIVHLNGHYHTWSRYTIGDIDAVMTRALFLDGTYGYSIVEVTDSVITISEKLLDELPAIKYEITVNSCHKPMCASEQMAFVLPDGFDVQCVHTDSASIFTRLAFDAYRVYFGTSTGHAKAIDKKTKSVQWKKSMGAALFGRFTVLPHKKVAIPHATGIAVLDAYTGHLLDDLASDESPYVADGLLVCDSLYIQGGFGRCECRNAISGAIVWRLDSIGNYCQASPAVSGNLLVFGAWDTYLRGVDVDRGELIWKWSNGKSNNLFSAGNVVPAVNNRHVIIVAPDRYMTAIDRNTGLTIWRDNSHRYRESMGVSCDGSVVYAKTMDGELVAVDALSNTFNELWLCDMGIGYDHAPCVVAEVDGIVYAGSRRGIVTAVSSSTHEILWQLTLGNSEINGIDVDPFDGSVWLSLIEGKIYKINKIPAQG